MLLTTFLGTLAIATVTALSHSPADYRIYAPHVNGKSATINGGDIHYTPGGSVLTGPVPIYLIYYGGWNQTQKNLIETFTNGLSSSAWWKTQQKYYYQKDATSPKVYVDNHVTVAGTASNNYSVGKAFSGSMIKDLIQAYITNGTFPENSNAIYYIVSTADVTEVRSKSGFCGDYCAYHSDIHLKSGTTVYFGYGGLLPANCVNGCAPPPNQTSSPNNDVSVDALLSAMAHEIVETISDPDLFNTGWVDYVYQENADKCAWTYGNVTIADNGASYNMGWGADHHYHHDQANHHYHHYQKNYHHHD
ncbi:hypothetical protein BDV3_007306 [Batrachochytrium dendrobatidis]